MSEENRIREIKAKGLESEDVGDFGDAMQSSLYSKFYALCRPDAG